MPEYLYPGVYVEEVDTGNKPIEGVSTSTVGFLGVAERGPTTPVFVTSYPEFTRIFGSYFLDGATQRYLAYGVEGFFLNGGLRCWIVRVASVKAAPASSSAGPMGVAASGPGSWGNRVGFKVEAAGLPNANLFKLTVACWATTADANGKDLSKAAQLEVFDNLSSDPKASTFYAGAVNGVSNLVTLKANATGQVPMKPLGLLVGGGDGDPLAEADFVGNPYDPSTGAGPTGIVALESLDDVSLLCCPDETALGKGVIAKRLDTSCNTLKDRFAILQSTATEGQPASVTASVVSKYAAYYYPWLNVIDPKSSLTLLIPPGGHVAGIYARSDTERGVHKDPANEVIRGIDSLQLKIDDQTQGSLNPRGVNALRYFKGHGNLVWGGRTTSDDPDWKYVNVRRLFIFVEKSIQRGTQWVVFEPNDETTWARVRRSVGGFLENMWRDGMLQGATKEQAYFVRCDRTTMTQADLDNGRLIVVIGIAPVKPAEFVIFRIGQWTGGSDVTEG